MIIQVLLALLLDYLFKEPKKFHPLVGFGKWVDFIEGKLNVLSHAGSQKPEARSEAHNNERPKADELNQGVELQASSVKQSLASLKYKGIYAWSLAVLPLTLLAFWLDHALQDAYFIHMLFSSFVLYLCIGWQSLISHAKAISEPLLKGDIDGARYHVSMIVSRDTSSLDEEQIAKAGTESVLENGADAIFAAIFWFCFFGVPGVILYRLSNTLDAMWGYKNDRFYHFGFAAARIDDALNYIPARLTALTYAFLGNFNQAIKCWRTQAPTWKSPNAGPVMAAGAGALEVSLGGGAEYHGQWQDRPLLGVEGNPAKAETLDQACELVTHSIGFWVVVMAVVALL